MSRQVRHDAVSWCLGVLLGLTLVLAIVAAVALVTR